MIDKIDLDKVLKESIEIYNRYRAPEAVVEILGIDKDILIAKFSGYFCVTCGVIDWIEDYIYILKDLGVDAQIVKVDYFTEDNYVLVKIRIVRY
ncbi:MAG: hypothetical protein LM582_03255 [Desulfurococcaceae archaeon]|jgi:hypothetical protein|nr:hypothetical protein [Desulfurococcaceae archaeon]